MSLTIPQGSLRLFGCNFDNRIHSKIYKGMPLVSREGSLYDFFNKNGLKLSLSTVTGERLPEDFVEELSKPIIGYAPNSTGKRSSKKAGLKSVVVDSVATKEEIPEIATEVSVAVAVEETPSKPEPKRRRVVTSCVTGTANSGNKNKAVA